MGMVLNEQQRLFVLTLYNYRDDVELDLDIYEKFALQGLYERISVVGAVEINDRLRLRLNTIRKLYIQRVLKK